MFAAGADGKADTTEKYLTVKLGKKIKKTIWKKKKKRKCAR